MVAGQEPPIPPNDPQQESGELIDPKTGKRVPTRDMRQEFARISAAEGRDPEAERAFVESKFGMIRTHPTLSEAEKKAAIADLEETLKRDT
jgi:hypothetical protein